MPISFTDTFLSSPASSLFTTATPDRMSYELITPQYSPDTVTAITLRHFEKQSKEQAEHEYDVEHGLLPPPPPDDDPTIAPSVRSIHKKKRKVRSAIVSRRKTAIYVQKLEEELDTRESLNAKLNSRLASYSQSLQSIRDQIAVLEAGSTPRRQRGPADPHASSSLQTSTDMPAAVSAALPPSMRFPPSTMAPSAAPSFEPRFPSFEPPLDAADLNSALGFGYAAAPAQQATPLAPLAVPPPTQPPMTQGMAPSALSSVFQRQPQLQQAPQPTHHHSQPTDQDLPEFFPEQELNEMLNSMSAAQAAPTAKAVDSADFSECSDRNISPAIRPSVAPSPPSLANLPPVVNPIEQAAAAFVASRDARSWRQASLREPFVM